MNMREEPLECVEFMAPFNPRGDDYQTPSGSSHGSAAGIASYNWLDFAIGTDTNGGGRKPAHYNGCFSVRPSRGVLNTSGVVRHFPQFDMPVVFGRDISKFYDFVSAWFAKTWSDADEPVQVAIHAKWSDSESTQSEGSQGEGSQGEKFQILYPLDYFPVGNEAQTRLTDNFVKGLESALQVKRTKIDLAAGWKADHPDGIENDDIAQYLGLAVGRIYHHDAHHALVPFMQEYQKTYGEAPFIHRSLREQLGIAKAISPLWRDWYWNRVVKYREWLLDTVFQRSDSEGIITIMVLPVSDGKPFYREDEAHPPVLSGFDALYMAPIMGAPVVTAIVGETTYNSIVSQREEPMPVAVSVVAAPGKDFWLIDIVKRGMEAAGIPLEVKTGRSVYGDFEAR
ncbi:amidase signature domain-containing protein [Diplogelasinospora grovesii]|uniref:Amidase signature domain-containing protein n=1 Tax=Diplogelasinospora grovesii TaxID=303347 RepID=A0AAN6N6A7_9PEZI|nr:amidase signature domain-containing protein [Diplogelasinospora grovesii]